MALAACNASGEQKAADRSPVWIDAVDGSKVAISQENEVSGQTYLYRCWPVRGQYDCLSVVKGAFEGGEVYMGVRAMVDKLPNSHQLFFSSEDIRADYSFRADYLCEIDMDGGSPRHVSESIKQKGAILTSNLHSSGASTRPWPRTHFSQWVSENKLQAGEVYFDCGHIGELVGQGSFQTLGTAMLRYDDLG